VSKAERPGCLSAGDPGLPPSISRNARDLAVHLLVRYQGAALLTSTLRDPDLMAREAARTAKWIDALD
jgi:hypothetical protein